MARRIDLELSGGGDFLHRFSFPALAGRAAGQGDDPLRAMRLAGARMLIILFWLNIPILAFAAALVDAPDAVAAPLVAGVLALLPTVMVLRGDVSASARMTLALTAIAFPALYLFLLRGHEWQMDLHMTFFAALAMLTALLDRRAMLAGAAATAAHHLVLSYLQPAWVFADVGNLSRVCLHALIVLLQTAMLLWIIDRLTQLIRAQAQARALSEALRGEADEAKQRAEAALAALEKAQIVAEKQRVIEERARRAEEAGERRRLVADALEARLGAVVGDLGQLSRQLSTSKQWLFGLLDRTTSQSTELRAAHTKAEGDVRAVAQDTERLAASINEVGASASRTRHSAHSGAVATRALNPEVQALSVTVDAASSIVALISTIAAQSRTLSFNAGIEAARSDADTRGFTVVASEMKSLASQTAEATRQIDDYLEDIRRAARSVTGAIDIAARSVETADSSAAAIADQVADQIRATGEIAAATEEMARHIADAAAQAEALSSALVEAQDAMGRTDAAAGALSSRSVELQETVRKVLQELRAA
ncbi:methyl-accepting chemotaxis protein [Sphingobium sp. BYY-5]|uniref:methyl-accepting chemotaxis protein n=1 Tax=Sphingobium sp. BYY-5 TaxID=2926400 RepID=UPI001FA8086F|nr:methyl-accepting chemotaxis protein [Sphingobium sp. BYY-5]MCI4589789.1 methyl-accepting chemotaxis protein [Sphingobium sp. BYY-5]